MKIKNRLSLYCSLIYGIVFAVTSVLIYSLYYKNTEKAIFNNLNKVAYISALFYLEEDELNTKEFDKIRKRFDEVVSNSYYQIYDEGNRIAYGYKTFETPVSVLDRIRSVKQLSFRVDDFLCYGLFYEDNQGDFVVIAKENRAVLESQTGLLLWILIPLFVLGAVAIIFLSRWVANIAYRPFSEAVKEVKNISTNNLNVRIRCPQTEDELRELIDTFNELLTKISKTVIIQKNFVKYVSHEFKTPLASMVGNLDLFSLKDRTPEEYRRLSEMLIQQIFQMEEILNTLIIISELKTDERALTRTRVDELIWEIINKIKTVYLSSQILVNIGIAPEDEALMMVNVNRTELLIALYNLIENAVKYSKEDGKVEIHIAKEDGQLCLSISDTGIGIPEEELPLISEPFYRADNANRKQGSGIGLSLALRIFERNKIDYNIESAIDAGTRITVRFIQ
ncbi:HAMP domain-containing sensor histidine kinase [uncultured Bacteroides sp.]|uniref:sensor histidine kinase n=1 Tax=uncultured Bacteroides sp. TaxID=162156 RepID=UPI002676DC6D|nr:HAMP domain-containing sensor histidine kinase [uncultured Bacteroides sp.]